MPVNSLNVIKSIDNLKGKDLYLIAKERLIENIRNHDFIPKDSIYTVKNSKKVFLSSYIPFIGRKYFDYRPRILCYAINQNLSKHAPWSKYWIGQWTENINVALDRLNYAYSKKDPIPIKPYAEGFIPLAALVVIYKWISAKGGKIPKKIEDIITVSNFIKFSTYDNASSSGISNNWWIECRERFVSYEIDILMPDIIIAFGKRTGYEINKLLVKSRNNKTILLTFRFPNYIPSYKEGQLMKSELKIWTDRIYPLVKYIEKPSEKAFRKWRMVIFPKYFIDIYNSLNFSI